MNISTLAKVLGLSINDLRKTGEKEKIKGFQGRNTRIPYDSALAITKIIRPEKLDKLKNDDKVYVGNYIKVADFAEAIGKPPGLVVKSLLMNGVMVTLNESIDFDTASLIAEEMGTRIYPENSEDFYTPPSLEVSDVNIFEFDGENAGEAIERPPVVTVMGHVDHGKTTLLDTIRKSNVVAGEAGAITQHISGYQIIFKNKKITFIDTPGHEAFTAMRARGSQLADMIVLVVSTTEGPKPQTVEVIERAKLSKTPIIVALNKIDLPESDPEKTKTALTQFGIVPEEWGGDVPFIKISAKKGDGVEQILEQILLSAEVTELKGQINVPAEAMVVESHLDKQKGVVATVLVTRDRLEVGKFVACGISVGKVRTIMDSNQKLKQFAEIGEPVEITGLSGVADTGEIVKVFESKKDAENYTNIEKVKRSKKRVYYNNTKTEGNEIPVILKADVTGSLEALKESIIKIPQEHAKIVIKSESVGQVTETDIDFAITSNSTILAFHTDIENSAKNHLDRRDKSVNLVQSDIIYEILEWVEDQILKFVKHETRLEKIGEAEVLALFKSEKSTIQVLGGEVKDGKILSNKSLRIVRREVEIGRVEIVELQRNKDKVKEVNIAQQFGVSVSGNVKIQVGDILECVDEIVIR